MPATGGIRPKSVFQIGGAGAVGTGSIRGMPILKRLRDAGFVVWPFDAPRLPLVVEIYPRVLTGPVVKGSADERRRYLDTHYPDLAAHIVADAVKSDDAFDALVSAFVMAAHRTDFAELAPASDAHQQLEGQIWFPDNVRGATPPARGRFNSSTTRVAPVFNAFKNRANNDPQWLRQLLDLVTAEGRHERLWHSQDLTFESSHYEPTERPLQPPLALLSWLVRHLNVPPAQRVGEAEVTRERRKLVEKDPATIERALELLRRTGTKKGWHILEWPTYPDVFLVTPNALVVIEGKRMEAGPTTSTTWMPGRHQMLRHLDAAWEIRGRRSVYGFFIVEAEDGHGTLPSLWREAGTDTVSDAAISGSLPHRSPEERAGIARSFLGITTWQAIVAAFGLDPAVLPEMADASKPVIAP